MNYWRICVVGWAVAERSFGAAAKKPSNAYDWDFHRDFHRDFQVRMLKGICLLMIVNLNSKI